MYYKVVLKTLLLNLLIVIKPSGKLVLINRFIKVYKRRLTI